MKRKLSKITVLGMVLSGLSAAPAHASPLDVNGDGTVQCTSGSFSVFRYRVVSHSQCSGHANIPAGVISIDDQAFDAASAITSLTIPNSVTSIGNDAFSGASSLSSLTIPNSVTSIGRWAFADLPLLTSLTIPSSVTSIEEGAFSGASSLTSLTIPNSVTSIGATAFAGASSLTSLTIPNSVTSIGITAFMGAGALSSLTIPNSVTSIGASAFLQAIALTSLTIPNSVTTIGASAFGNASSLNSVTFLGPPAFVLAGAFDGLSPGARAFVSRTHIGSGAGKYGNVGDDWNGLRVSLPSSTLSLNSAGAVTTQVLEETSAPANPQLSRTGFTLAGWSATDGGAATLAADLSDFTMGSSATTLFAVWEPVPAVVEPEIAEEETPVTQFSGTLIGSVNNRVFDSNSAATMTLVGKRMHQITSATIDGVKIEIRTKSRGSLTLAKPGMAPGIYTLVFETSAGKLTLPRFLVVK